MLMLYPAAAGVVGNVMEHARELAAAVEQAVVVAGGPERGNEGDGLGGGGAGEGINEGGRTALH